MANGWTGERLSDWTGSGSNLRVYGTNGHHDTTWLATSTGSVSQALRYDPWGNPRTAVPTGYSPFRFQGSWFDEATDISWVVTRWYAPAMGRFISEDSLLGEPIDPPSRHLYAYGAGEPIGRWDPDGRWWRRVRSGDTLGNLAANWLGGSAYWKWIWNRNRERIKHPSKLVAGWCLWIPKPARKAHDSCTDRRTTTGIFDRNSKIAADKLGVNLNTLTWPKLISVTNREIDRDANPEGITSWWYQNNADSIERFVDKYVVNLDLGRVVSRRAGVAWKVGHPNPLLPPAGSAAITIGDTVFLESESGMGDDGLTAHEYMHVLQGEDRGLLLWGSYLKDAIDGGGGPGNRTEAIGYLW